ncbi:unnamed protein product [Clavelina lepadiformis]|uniref:Uncharacterized protein n=1 Tax=Clavelina lepadiformis TaxID=159417 RepID=A0ABP0GCA9_CLALP
MKMKMRFFVILALLFTIFIISSSSKKLKKNKKHVGFPRGAGYAVRRGGSRKINSSASNGLKRARIQRKHGTNKKRSRRVRRKKLSLAKWCRVLEWRFHICDRTKRTRKFFRSCGAFRSKKIGYKCFHCRSSIQFCNGKGKIFGI